jgi:2-methylaconitate cis-trans-isomerase PrpF
LSGRQLTPTDMEITVRFISVGQPHRATPLTGALCLAAACKIAGTIPNQIAAAPTEDATRLAHPSGVIHVGAGVTNRENGPEVSHATVFRTARRLFEGTVLYRG